MENIKLSMDYVAMGNKNRYVLLLCMMSGRCLIAGGHGWILCTCWACAKP